MFAASAALFGITAIASYLLAQRVPFNALEFLWDPRQPWWLALTYLLLFVPFFFAALCVCLVFTRFAARAARVYSYDILGAAAGCLGIVLLLFVLAPTLALGCIGATGLLAAALALLSQRPRRQAPAVALLGMALLLPWLMSGAAGALRMSPYKELSQTLEVMGARVLAQRSGPLGLVTVVESPQVPLRHAPGLSLGAPAGPPEQLALFTDGEGMSAIQRFDGRLDSLAWLDYMTRPRPTTCCRGRACSCSAPVPALTCGWRATTARPWSRRWS